MSDTFMGHPKGLLYCALTEVWERFAYYGMISMLILYLTKSYLISDGDGNRIVGAVGAMLYMSPVLGGAVADRWLGARKSIIAGTVLMAVGFLTMSLPNGLVAAIGLDGGPGGLPSIDFLYLSIAIIVVGNGCVKSNLNKLVDCGAILLFEPVSEMDNLLLLPNASSRRQAGHPPNALPI